MANKTLLRNCMRSGLLLLRHRQASSAGHQLCISPRMDQLFYPLHHHHHHRRFRRHRSCSVGGHEADLHLPGGYGGEAVRLQSPADRPSKETSDGGCKLQATGSHSCSTLHFRTLRKIPYIRSLLRRPPEYHHRCPSSSSSGVIDTRIRNEGSDSLHTNTTPALSPRECKRFWGFSKDRQRRRFHGELADCSSGGKGKRPPKGHVTIYVDNRKERVVVPIPYLSHPCFELLLNWAENEYGYAHSGGLLLPCSLAHLRDTLSHICLDNHNHHNQKANPT